MTMADLSDNGEVIAESVTSSRSVADDIEVKKLKDLVKKLEKQNEHLRNRTGKLHNNSNRITRGVAKDIAIGGTNNPNLAPTSNVIRDGITENGNYLSCDDIDILHDDVINSVDQDDFTWLYESPTHHAVQLKVTAEHKSPKQSPKQWLTEEIEHPSTPELISAKRNIIFKLERHASDLSYLSGPVEKKLAAELCAVDELKLDDPTDVQVVAHLQHQELERNAKYNYAETGEVAPRSTHSSEPLPKFNSDEGFGFHRHSRSSSSSSGSGSGGAPTGYHHLPLPSQTMTTAHGLFAKSRDPHALGEQITSNTMKRSSTPTRGSSPSRQRAVSPLRHQRANSPLRHQRATSPLRHQQPLAASSGGAKPRATANTPVPKSSLLAPVTAGRNLTNRRSLPVTSGSRSLNRNAHHASSTSLPEHEAHGGGSGGISGSEVTSQGHQPVIRSSASASRLSRLSVRTPASTATGRSNTLPTNVPPSMRAASAVPTTSPQTNGPTMARRSLPRPSQMRYASPTPSARPTSTNNNSNVKPALTSRQSPYNAPPPAADIWGEDEEVF